VINWLGVAVLALLSYLVRKFYFASYSICPLVTLYIYFYLSTAELFTDLEKAYNIVVVGVALTYLILTLLGMSWIVNTLAAIPVFTVLMWRQGKLLMPNESAGLVVFRVLFLTVVYGFIAYRYELLYKQAFLHN
jgi:hypothetical protein